MTDPGPPDLSGQGRASPPRDGPDGSDDRPILTLFVLGHSETVRQAVHNAQTLGPVVVVDVRENPGAAEAAHILATPTLVRSDDTPARIVGDLRDLAAVRRHLGPPFDRPDAPSDQAPPPPDDPAGPPHG